MNSEKPVCETCSAPVKYGFLVYPALFGDGGQHYLCETHASALWRKVAEEQNRANHWRSVETLLDVCFAN
jgi:hypothetical protein